MPRGWFFFNTSITFNFTSAELNGLPSWNFTSLRSLKVMALPSGAAAQLCARLALGSRSNPYSSSPSNPSAVTWLIGPAVRVTRRAGSGWDSRVRQALVQRSSRSAALRRHFGWIGRLRCRSIAA
jgi:hypothetical protein